MSGKGWEFSPDAQKCSKIISNMDFEKRKIHPCVLFWVLNDAP